MADSNDTLSNGQPYKETGRIGGTSIEGHVRILDHSILVTKADGTEVSLANLFSRFDLSQSLVIDITSTHRESAVSVGKPSK